MEPYLIVAFVFGLILTGSIIYFSTEGFSSRRSRGGAGHIDYFKSGNRFFDPEYRFTGKHVNHTIGIPV
jgi:hypothetical protein